ncbi:hypothetical protein LVB77_08890 [Lysobacter sp. 5GHs7-4]|uniref:hypothetical protein n=1 Tax=Lysobacter sp. 5GHs7-4 TaxID=2904253 RepID=UPI001E52056A|nr:hypothetical protein [Lysobacter sp. 5GHs7-4]UHQ24777.1 hypothetical protein LVB77_08890 [Lysobacter sp. 5GHs7-4]
MKSAALALIVCAALCGRATAAEAPPAEPEHIEPVPLTHKIKVKAWACEDHVGEDAEPGLRTSWSGKGELRLQGLLYHGGDETLAAADVSAWQVGDRVVVAYQLKSDPFPEAPSLMCPGFTHLDIRFPPLRTRPREVTVYAGRLRYTDEPESVAVPEK